MDGIPECQVETTSVPYPGEYGETVLMTWDIFDKNDTETTLYRIPGCIISGGSPTSKRYKIRKSYGIVQHKDAPENKELRATLHSIEGIKETSSQPPHTAEWLKKVHDKVFSWSSLRPYIIQYGCTEDGKCDVL